MTFPTKPVCAAILSLALLGCGQPEESAKAESDSGAAKTTTAKTVIRVQSVIPAKADEVTMLKDFAANVRELTQGEVEIEVLPAGAVVGVKETLDAVDKGLIEGGFAWTHYWSGKHPAAALFGSPTAGAGLGLDNIAWISWYMFGGGKQLWRQPADDRLWDEMGVNVKGLMLQPVGPEALGWFKEPIHSMDDFRKYRYRAPPGIPGQTYSELGIADWVAAIFYRRWKKAIDAAEWCCPKPDSVFGFQKSPAQISICNKEAPKYRQPIYFDYSAKTPVDAGLPPK